jgi:hypothetical protein
MLREEHRVRVFETIELRRILGPNRKEITQERRKLQNEELHLYSSANIISMINQG